MATILCVEDEPVLRILVQEIIEAKTPHHVEQIATGEAALQRFEATGAPRPDLVLLDVDLPGMSGIEVLRQLRASTAAAAVPVIMITAHDTPAMLTTAFDEKASDFIGKPFHPAELVARVSNLLQLSEELQIRRQREAELAAQAQELERQTWELARANSMLQAFSMLDPLLGIANRRGFDTAFAETWARMKSLARPLSLLFVDVDRFKGINDTFGHPVGDEALKSIVEVLKTVVGDSTHVLARYGGDEFAILLPEAEVDGATATARRICEAVAATPLIPPDSDRAIALSVSIGVGTVVPTDTDDPAALVARADEAVYAAKEAGRGRVSAA